MDFSFTVRDWLARAPGLVTGDEWTDWAQGREQVDAELSLGGLTVLPMMTARRLNLGSRLAVDCGLALLQQHDVDAVVYTSRHGELERNFRILQSLATGQPVSPTDFTMSVHNSSVGHLTIVARQPLPCTSVSAGQETFQQGLCEVVTLLHAGYQRVLMVDFDGHLPDFYHADLPPAIPVWPHVLALVIEPGHQLVCRDRELDTPLEQPLPQALSFLRGYLRGDAVFTVPGHRRQWEWRVA